MQQKPYGQNLVCDNINVKREIEFQLSQLLDETTLEDDNHDVVIKINNHIFPAHKYILASGSNLLDLCNENDEIILKDINVEFFQQLLNYIYTGTCTLLETGECPPQFAKYCLDYSSELHSKTKKVRLPDNPIRMLQEISKRFGCMTLYHILNDYFMAKTSILRKNNVVNRNKIYRREDFPEYYDIVLKCCDNKEIKAHKCILIARLEYFRNLFAVRWSNVS